MNPITRDGLILTPGAGNIAGAWVELETMQYSHVGRKGDLTVQLHYGDLGTGHGRQAAFYIFCARRERHGVFVPLSMMWQYAERDALHTMIPPLAEQVFGFVTKQDAYRLLDAILDYLDDLRKSPPDPQLFVDRSLDAFLKSCEDEGVSFFVEMGGRRVIG